MPFRIEVLVKKQAGSQETEWRAMRPTGDQPYEWPTRNEAQRQLEMCYPIEYRLRGGLRVMEVPKPPMDTLAACLIIDGTTEASQEQIIEAYQHLINTDIVWQLQGIFGRTAANLIEQGACEGKVPWA